MPEPSHASLTTVFRAADPHRIRRNRQAVSCTACQRHKSKCDRQKPCGACKKRGNEANCRFGITASVSGGRQEAQARLTKLGELVRGLADRSGTLPDRSERQVGLAGAYDGGQQQLADGPEETYHGPTFWAALVDSIQGIQNVLKEAKREPAAVPENKNNSPSLNEPEVVFGHASPITIEEILQALPPKQDCDRVISAYFNAKFTSIPSLHAHHFRRRYDAFWEDPTCTGFLWDSILFSILAAGAVVLSARPPSHSVANVAEPRLYMNVAARCLVSGEYMKAKPMAVEAVLAYTHSRNVQKEDSDASLWMLWGILVRLAQRRGYHRDPSKVSTKITLFEAEMRRRCWLIISSHDLLFSFQHGLPPIIHEEACDTDHPTILTDEDFDEDTVVLPRPRPSTDPLPILAYVYKSHLSRIQRRIIRQALRVTPSPYSETLALHAELEQWHASIPPCLRIRSIRCTAFTDFNYTIMHRIMLEIMFRKSLCILHRPYLSREKSDPEMNKSREACRDAAVGVLHLHIELDQEIKPGGRMYDDRYMVRSLTLHDFLVAAMIVGVDLSESVDLS